jgi:hypothetical protein
MSYSIVRVAKVKGKTNTTGVQKHVQRENERYENRDIEHDKTYLNYDLVNKNKVDFNEKIDAIIEQNYNGKRKIRTDAIKHIDGVITSDSEFFENKSPDDIRAFFSDAKDFLDKEYGESNLVYATVHMDEKTPHMHFGAVPLTEDGRLSAREVIGNKKSLTKFQDRFNEHVNNKGHDLERGVSRHKTDAQHKHAEKYKNDMKRLKAQKDETKQALSKVKQNGRTEVEKLNDIKLEMTNIQEQIEHEKALRDQIRAEKEKEEEQYQNLVNVLEKPVNDEYEHEYKKPSMFSREKEPTGNVIISEDNYRTLKQRSDLAARLEPEFKRLNSGQERKQDKERINHLTNENAKLKKQNKNLKNERDEVINDHKSDMSLVKQGCQLIKKTFGEQVYHKGINMIDDKVKSDYKARFREIVSVDDSDKRMFKQKDDKISQMQFDAQIQNTKVRDKDKGFDLDR